MSKLHRHLHRLAGRPREPRPKAAVHTAVDRTTPVVLPPVRERWDVVMLSPAANEGTLARINAAGFDVWRPRAVLRPYRGELTLLDGASDREGAPTADDDGFSAGSYGGSADRPSRASAGDQRRAGTRASAPPDDDLSDSIPF